MPATREIARTQVPAQAAAIVRTRAAAATGGRAQARVPRVAATTRHNEQTAAAMPSARGPVAAAAIALSPVAAAVPHGRAAAVAVVTPCVAVAAVRAVAAVVHAAAAAAVVAAGAPTSCSNT